MYRNFDGKNKLYRHYRSPARRELDFFAKTDFRVTTICRVALTKSQIWYGFYF